MVKVIFYKQNHILGILYCDFPNYLKMSIETIPSSNDVPSELNHNKNAINSFWTYLNDSNPRVRGIDDTCNIFRYCTKCNVNRFTDQEWASAKYRSKSIFLCEKCAKQWVDMSIMMHAHKIKWTLSDDISHQLFDKPNEKVDGNYHIMLLL